MSKGVLSKVNNHKRTWIISMIDEQVQIHRSKTNKQRKIETYEEAKDEDKSRTGKGRACQYKKDRENKPLA